jgi:hypothetical protein
MFLTILLLISREILIIMCCAIYYVYYKIRNYLRKRAEEKAIKKMDEVLYNTYQLNKYIRDKKRVYWASY